MLGYDYVCTHDTTATLYRWMGAWGITRWSADNKTILGGTDAVLDDFGALVEIGAASQLANSYVCASGCAYFDDEVLAECAYFFGRSPARSRAAVTAEVIEREGEHAALRLSHDPAPFGVPCFYIDAPHEERLLLTRGQLLAPLLGLEVSTAPAASKEH